MSQLPCGPEPAKLTLEVSDGIDLLQENLLAYFQSHQRQVEPVGAFHREVVHGVSRRRPKGEPN